MNLNKFDRQAFVRAVMDDVPMTDYQDIARKKAKETVISLMPKEVQAVYNNHPSYLNSSGVSLPGMLENIYMPTPSYSVIKNSAPEVWAEMVEMEIKLQKQNTQRKALEEKITAIIEGCRTLKQAKERLPEFEKYLPAERGTTGTKNLPVANLVAELNAAGWPNGK